MKFRFSSVRGTHYTRFCGWMNNMPESCGFEANPSVIELRTIAELIDALRRYIEKGSKK